MRAPLSGGIYNGDLITIGGGGLSIGAKTAISFTSNPSVLGDYRLFGGNISGAATGNFLLPTAPSGDSYAISTSIDAGYLDLVVTSAGGGGGSWTGSGTGGSWANPSNWPGSTIPSSGTVTFAGALSDSATITLDGNQSAGALVFNASSSNGYTLAQGTTGVLTLGTPSAGASIVVISGTHGISAPVELTGNLTVSMTNGGSLLESGSVSGAASLTLSGDGQLILSGTGSFNGGTNVDSGTLYVANTSAIADGTSLTVGAGGVFLYDPTAGAAANEPAVTEKASDRSLAPVPEPGTLVLLLAALWSAVACHRFSRRPRQTNPRAS